MKRSFNYTNRYRMDNEWFDFSVYEQTSGISKLTYHIKLLDSRFEGCRCWLEIYHGSKIKRIDCGTFTTPIENECSLMEFDKKEPVLLRIKMVDGQDKHCLIRGWRDEIRPTVYDVHGHEKKSLLPVAFKNLGNLVWKIELKESPPTLYVNDRTGINEEYVKSNPVFTALVFPQVLREILMETLKEDSEDEEQNDWIKFAINLVGHPYEKYESDTELNNASKSDWIEEVIQEFSKINRLLTKFMESEDA